jgi:hypothetical protein
MSVGERRAAPLAIVAGLALALSACATTARLHTATELNDVGARCGLALGELFQDEGEKKLLFLFKVQPTAAERSCVHAWARKNGLRTVFIDAINDPAS